MVNNKDFYQTLNEASAAAISLGIKNQQEYNLNYKKDHRLHSDPKGYYSKEWEGWYLFLGKRNPKDKYATLAEASVAALALGFSSQSDYYAGYQEDAHLPSRPDNYYSNEWKNWYAFLKKPEPVEKYSTLSEASTAARALGFKSQSEYKEGYRQDPRLPLKPERSYATEWDRWYNFLRTDQKSEIYSTIEEASAAARILGLTSAQIYRHSYRQDKRLPRDPTDYYAEDWTDWFNFLGMQPPGELYSTLSEASSAAKDLGFTTSKEYYSGYRHDPRLPANPDQVYKEDWKSWYNFLGKNDPKNNYKTLKEASLAAQALGFTTSNEYRSNYHLDPLLNANPERLYASEWSSWYKFLGTMHPQEKYATLAEASAAAQDLGFKNQSEYKAGYKVDPHLPLRPERSYSKEWNNWYEFLGSEIPAEKYATLSEARSAAQALGLKSQDEYKKNYHKDPRLPSTEESPNDFDKNHKFKVDAHLVM